MIDFSIADRIVKIFEMIISSSFFISLFIIIVLTIIILLINAKVKSKIPKYIAASIYTIIMVYTLIKYGNYILSLNDKLADQVFKTIYFPNLVTYICMLLITVLIMLIAFIKKYSNLIKIGNITCFSLIWFFFILILDFVKNNNINIYDLKEVYQNETLMILLQASMNIFFIWVGVLLIDYIVKKILISIEKQKEKIVREKIDIDSAKKFNEVRQFTDEEFEIGYLNQNKLKRNKKIKEILKQK